MRRAATTPAEVLKQLVLEAHLMIKLTAITSEEEPHSTVAAFLVSPSRDCDIVHAGDSRVYHFRGAEHGQPHDRPLLRAAPGRRRPDHRGRSQRPPAVQPADRLPGHERTTRRCRTSTSTSSRSATACWPAATACGTTSRRARSAPSCTRCRRARRARCWSARRASVPAAAATTCRSRWCASRRWSSAALSGACRRAGRRSAAARPPCPVPRAPRLRRSTSSRCACAARWRASNCFVPCALALRAAAIGGATGHWPPAAARGARLGGRAARAPARASGGTSRPAHSAARLALRLGTSRQSPAPRRRSARGGAPRRAAVAAGAAASASRGVRLRAASDARGDDEPRAGTRAPARRSACSPRRARPRSDRSRRSAARRRPRIRSASAQAQERRSFMSATCRRRAAPVPGTRPTASRAGATPCAETRAPAALRCTAPRARPRPT